MAKVYNWQLGREMDYPYEVQRPERQRRERIGDGDA